LNDSQNIKLNQRIGYTKYEIAELLYRQKKYEKAEKYLNKAKAIGNPFLIERCNIELITIKLKKTKNYMECFKLFNEVINNSDNQYIRKEAYDLKLKLYNKLEPDILILNSNPLSSGVSVLHSGIYSYINNQYYLLQKLHEKIKLNIKIKSIVLNKKNLEDAFNKEGKLLIIQSDDYSKEGDIILESDIGKSQKLPNEQLKLELLPKIVKYKVVILCFINSYKLIELFKDKVEYLITFDKINLNELDDNILLKYNELSIDFLINFIEKSIESNIESSFEFSKKCFIDKINEIQLNNIKSINYINLTKQADKGQKIPSFIYEKNIFKENEKEKGKEIFLYYPFPDLPYNYLRNKNYANEIFDIIKKIIKQRYDLLNICIKDDNRINLDYSRKINKRTLISIEIMRFLYRHQIFNDLFYVFNPKKYGYSLKNISDNIIYNNLIGNESESETSNSIFILINNFDRIKPFKYLGDNLELAQNVQYLVMSKKDIIMNVNEKNCDGCLSDKKYKKKILVNDKKYKIFTKFLESDVFNGKKNFKKNNLKENQVINNELFENFSIFNDSFHSEKTWSSKSESEI
jgi:hypothetical protein